MRVYTAPPTRVSPLSTAFRALESILRRDSALNTAIKTWRSWTGDVDDKEQPATGSMPFVRITPLPASSQWLSPASHEEDLLVQIEIAYAGTCIDDGLDLWRAVELAIYPTDVPTRTANQQLLQSAGVRGGVCTITQPAIDRSLSHPDHVMSVVAGAVKLRVVATT